MRAHQVHPGEHSPARVPLGSAKRTASWTDSQLVLPPAAQPSAERRGSEAE
jgi:hypothetical protein